MRVRRILPTAPLLLAVFTIATSCATRGGAGRGELPLAARPDDPVDAIVWTTRPVPASDSEERECANWSRRSWRVSTVDDRVVFTPYQKGTDWTEIPDFLRPKRKRARERIVGTLTAIEVPDGFLVGNDIGEFGGWVAWYSKSGARRAKLFEGNPVGFASVGASIAVVEGLGHLGLRHGSVHYLERAASGRWRTRATVDLGDVPYAFTADGSVITIVTSAGVIEVSEGGKRRVAAADYAFLYPNSVAAVHGDYYVGMRYAVSRLTPTGEGYSESWLVPTHCARLERVSEDECRCVETTAE